MSEEPKFVIQGSDYPVPDWISFTMDESEILYDKAKITLADVDEDTPFTPGLLSSLMIVAYMRGNPGMSRKAAEAVVGQIVMAEAIEHLFPKSDEDDAVPPLEPSVTEPLDESARNDGSERSSGSSGLSDSELSQASIHPLPTGTQPSDTPQESASATSAG